MYSTLFVILRTAIPDYTSRRTRSTHHLHFAPSSNTVIRNGTFYLCHNHSKFLAKFILIYTDLLVFESLLLIFLIFTNLQRVHHRLSWNSFMFDYFVLYTVVQHKIKIRDFTQAVSPLRVVIKKLFIMSIWPLWNWQRSRKREYSLGSPNTSDLFVKTALAVVEVEQR